MSDPLLLMQHKMGPKLRGMMDAARSCLDIPGSFVYFGVGSGRAAFWMAKLLSYQDVPPRLIILGDVSADHEKLMAMMPQSNIEWAFVHPSAPAVAALMSDIVAYVQIDYDSYDLTIDALFLSGARMLSASGLIFVSHYAAQEFPGVKIACDEFMASGGDDFKLELVGPSAVIVRSCNTQWQQRQNISAEVKTLFMQKAVDKEAAELAALTLNVE